MFKFTKLVAAFLCTLIVACTTTENKPLLIDFSADSTAIVISNINKDGLLQLKNNLKTDSAYQKIVSVLQTPAEDDSTSMEIEWPGKLALNGDQLVYTPDSAFKKGKHYLVLTIINAKFAKAEEILKSEVGHQIKSQQKILRKD
jgi:hypothetical protein